MLAIERDFVTCSHPYPDCIVPFQYPSNQRFSFERSSGTRGWLETRGRFLVPNVTQEPACAFHVSEYGSDNSRHIIITAVKKMKTIKAVREKKYLCLIHPDISAELKCCNFLFPHG